MTECKVATIVVGNTGDGKSILLNYLSGVQLKSVENELSEIVLEVVDKEKIVSKYSH